MLTSPVRATYYYLHLSSIFESNSSREVKPNILKICTVLKAYLKGLQNAYIFAKNVLTVANYNPYILSLI